jgi:hypothetical protein
VNFFGRAFDLVESVAEALDDPESRPAGSSEPHYPVSEKVTVSRDNGMYVYHLPDDQLGQGSSFGNARAWAETKGNGDMLRLFSVELGRDVLGGMSVSYLLPFSDLSGLGRESAEDQEPPHDSFARAMPSAPGAIHLHPAYQQREFVLGDGLHVLETFYLPRTGMDDRAVAHAVVALKNRTSHPVGITLVASLDLRGETPRDITATFDQRRGAVVAHNASHSDWVRVFGGNAHPKRHYAGTDEEQAYSPREPLGNCTEEIGDLTGALQYDVLLFPSRGHKLRLTAAFSSKGRRDALAAFDRAREHGALKETIAHYQSVLKRAVLELPDALLTQGVQWAKACLIRPLSRYPIGEAVTNDPARSTHLVGRDTAWYIHGCDFVNPQSACSMLRVFAERQREDGLIAEHIDGNSGEAEDHGFNINDNTPLFVMAVAHHIKATGDQQCLQRLYEPACRAGDLILRARDGRGLVRCTADGTGLKGICGWRNVLQNEQITGVVTELNAECYAALRSLADLGKMRQDDERAARFGLEADRLRQLINGHLIDPKTGLYIRNIDLEGRVFTQATVDMVFPAICGVSDAETTLAVGARLAEPDFMTEGGIRALPAENPRYDPSFRLGLLGGVWPGATWWYAMSCSRGNPETMAESLLRSYRHYVSDPRTFNTVPGQFSEWSDGQTLVNRGMRLSPREAPRFLWAAIEGLAGVTLSADSVTLDPQLPPHWHWMHLCNLPYRGRRLSFFIARQTDGLHAYLCEKVGGDLQQHVYNEELAHAPETLTTGVSTAAFRRDKEVLVCVGSSLETRALGPFLTHHTLDSGKRYKVVRLNSIESDWRHRGVIEGSSLQRITVRLEPRGYALYRFIPTDA